MTEHAKCPRCYGPAEMISKAPRGESGDVIRCAVENQCVALTDAARELEENHSAVVDAAHEFTRVIGKPDRNADFRVPGYLYHNLRCAVEEWKEAGQTLHDATRRFAAARDEHASGAPLPERL